MSDFFAGVNGARFPDVVMNKGPLPGMGGLPTPLHDTADGRINYNSTLLGDIEPYAYGEPGYLSSQTSYLNIQHKVQKLVPYLFLPQTDGTENFRLDHPIDDGDIAFTLRLDRNSEICSGLSNKSMMRAGLGMAIDPMINLCTVNYLLAGVQICTTINDTSFRRKWDQLLHYLDARRFDGNHTAQYNFADLKNIVRRLIRPFGIAHGSEKQGGQHEGSYSPVTWPVNFVISLTLDGKDANLVNIWHKHDVEAGQDMVLRLKAVPIPPGNKYTLNHWHKNLVQKAFNTNTMHLAQQANGNRPITHVWQLVPDIFSMEHDSLTPDVLAGLPASFQPAGDYCWQQEGYWHIARSQVHARAYGLEEYYYNDMANNLRTAHIDVTFQPTFYAMPYRDFGHQNGESYDVVPAPPAAQNVFNLLGAKREARDWESSLRLEQRFGFTGAPNTLATHTVDADEEPEKRQRLASDGAVRVSRDLGCLLQRSEPPERPPLPALSALEEDIGVFEEAGPLPSRSHVSAGSHLFSVAKPGLANKQQPKRSNIKGKGVLSSILAADGSVTQEQSRML